MKWTGDYLEEGFACLTNSRIPKLGRGTDIGHFFAVGNRSTSPRVDFGSAWTLSAERGARYECFYLAGTRELCLLRQPIETDSAPAELVGVAIEALSNIWRRRKYSSLVWVLRTGAGLAEVDGLLSGWRQIEPQPDSLLWLLRQFLL